MATKLFNIVSHFKFEVGGAITNVGKLQGSVNKLSESADKLNTQFKGMLVSQALSFTGAGGGIMSMLHNSVAMSEKRYQTERKIAALLLANSKKLKTPLTDFNKALDAGSRTLSNIYKDAQKFAIPVRDIANTFTSLAPIMLPNKATGVDFDKTRKLSVNLQRAPDLLGLTPWQATQRIQSLVEGNVGSQGNMLFRRLASETDAFKPYKGSPNKWNTFARKNMGSATKKVNEALEQFFKNKDLNTSWVESLTGQFIKLKNSFSEFNDVLKPMGDIFRNKFAGSLKEINNWLDKHLAPVVQNFAPILKYLTSDFKSLYIQLDKLSLLSKDFAGSKGKASGLFIIIESLQLIKSFGAAPLRWLARFVAKFGYALPVTFSAVITKITKTTNAVNGLVKVFGYLVGAVYRYFKWFIPIMAATRILTSAVSHAKVNDIGRLADNIGNLSGYTKTGAVTLIKFQSVFSSMIDSIGQNIAFLFQKTWWIQKLGMAVEKTNLNVWFDKLAIAIIHLKEVIVTSLGFITKIYAFKHGAIGFKDLFKAGKTSVDTHFQKAHQKEMDYLKKWKNFEAQDYLDAKKGDSIINVGKVEIKNNFKENYEPDRIALTIKEAFTKAVQSPTSSIVKGQTQNPSLESG